MKNKLKLLAPFFDKDKYGLTSMSFIFALTFFIFFFSKETVKSEKDLLTINGKIDYYSFKNESRGRKIYFIKLESFSSKFRIKADFIDFFKGGLFLILKNGDSVSISIPKKRKDDLKKNEDIQVFDIRNNQFVFLNKLDTIAKHNNKFEILAGLVFLAISIIWYFYKKKKLEL